MSTQTFHAVMATLETSASPISTWEGAPFSFTLQSCELCGVSITPTLSLHFTYPQSNFYVGKQGLCSKTHHSIKFTSFIHSLSTLPSLLLQACTGMEDTPVNKADQVPAQWGSQPREKDTIKKAKYTQNDIKDEWGEDGGMARRHIISH